MKCSQASRPTYFATVTTKPTFAVTSRDSLFEDNYNLSIPLHANYDVSPDGKSFVLIRPVASDAQLVVVHGWRHELRERTRTNR